MGFPHVQAGLHGLEFDCRWVHDEIARTRHEKSHESRNGFAQSRSTKTIRLLPLRKPWASRYASVGILVSLLSEFRWHSFRPSWPFLRANRPTRIVPSMLCPLCSHFDSLARKVLRPKTAPRGSPQRATHGVVQRSVGLESVVVPLPLHLILRALILRICRANSPARSAHKGQFLVR